MRGCFCVKHLSLESAKTSRCRSRTKIPLIISHIRVDRHSKWVSTESITNIILAIKFLIDG